MKWFFLLLFIGVVAAAYFAPPDQGTVDTTDRRMSVYTDPDTGVEYFHSPYSVLTLRVNRDGTPKCSPQKPTP